MKIRVFIVVLFFPLLVSAQETWTYQSDSVYKVNKVKVRKCFNGEKLTDKIYYDQEGRMIKFALAPFIGGEQRTTYFQYDNNGRLINQVDSTRNGKPDKKTLKKLKKMGLDMSSQIRNNKSPLEVSKYDIEYANGIVSKLTKYNPDGSLDIVDNFEDNGRRKIRKWYRDGAIYREDTEEFIDEFHKDKYYGWEIQPNSSKMEWNYTFKYEFNNGRIDQFVRFEDGIQKETTKLTYNDHGLLIEAKYYTTERFEYEYYK
ncbi:MAG TPA: hypothetical protein VL443_09470 [Cyclobacteriaceae bacterium]|jgi:hypothetical protein|nr:hypothetical protein [Cyclobacteriaceae bacterium]